MPCGRSGLQCAGQIIARVIASEIEDFMSKRDAKERSGQNDDAAAEVAAESIAQASDPSKAQASVREQRARNDLQVQSMAASRLLASSSGGPRAVKVS